MSDLKFACPVCGQHITVDQSLGGSQLECPTCFRKLVVPHTAPDSKLILSATPVASPRSWIGLASQATGKARQHKALLGTLLGAGAVCLVLGAIASYWLPKHLSKPPPDLSQPVVAQPNDKHPRPGWTLDLTNAVVPGKPAAGRIAGRFFKVERATFRGNVLSLREGNSWPPDAGVSIALFSDKVGGKTLEVPADRPPPTPRITLRWKDAQAQPTNQTFHSGYALRLTFADPTNGMIAGKLFLALPDEKRSYVAGMFNAEIIKPGARKGGARSSTNAPAIQDRDRE